MLPIVALSLAFAAEPYPYANDEAELSAAIRKEELRAHVYRLASDEFKGRRGPGAARAGKRIAEAFEKLKLKPLFGDSYFQEVPWRKGEAKPMDAGFMGRNVGALMLGADPALKDEWILLSAHHDHLGPNGRGFYPGADDNASGVAMLLEVAEHFALAGIKPKRTIVFVSFDLEEVGLLGSKHFAVQPPLDLKNLRVFLTADMLGRSMANVMDEYLFVLGSESAAELRDFLEKNPPSDGLKLGRIGADIIGTRSDYGPFRDRKIPFLFFCTGMHADYHTERDTAEKIDYVRLEKIARWIADVTGKLADTDKPPSWANGGLPPDLDEVRSIHLILTRIMANPKAWPMTDSQRQLVTKTCERLKGFLDRGRISPAERTALVLTAKLLMAAMFN